MITFNDFTEEMRQDIIDAVKNGLLKLGINAQVTLSAKTLRDGREYISVETSEFNTTPVIYKSIHIYGGGSITDVDGNPQVYDMYVSLKYGFNYFSGGTNGVDIGTIRFRIFERTMRVACLGLTI